MIVEISIQTYINFDNVLKVVEKETGVVQVFYTNGKSEMFYGEEARNLMQFIALNCRIWDDKLP